MKLTLHSHSCCVMLRLERFSSLSFSSVGSIPFYVADDNLPPYKHDSVGGMKTHAKRVRALWQGVRVLYLYCW